MARGRVRAAVDEDLPAIVRLHEKIYATGAGGVYERRLAYLKNILFQHPWRDERVPSLIYEDTEGQIVGCLGVMPRPMVLQREPILMALTHNYMVDADHRSSLGSISLAQRFFSGAQQFSLCTPQDDTARKLWRACGASSARLYSFTWVRPLRPLTYIVQRLQQRSNTLKLWQVIQPLSRLVDKSASRLGYSPLPVLTRRHIREELTPEALLECMLEFASNRALRPVYTEATFPWLLEVLRGKRRYGRLKAQRVRTEAGQTLGYYLYYANDGGVSLVLHVNGKPGKLGEVLDELAREAWENGACALSGWLDPYCAEEISAKAAYLRYDHDAPLQMQSSQPAIELAVGGGQAFLTPLEGEWSLWFHN